MRDARQRIRTTAQADRRLENRPAAYGSRPESQDRDHKPRQATSIQGMHRGPMDQKLSVEQDLSDEWAHYEVCIMVFGVGVGLSVTVRQ